MPCAVLKRLMGELPSVILAEATSGATAGTDFTESVERLAAALRKRDPLVSATTRVVYGGTMRQSRGETDVIPWNAMDAVPWQPETKIT